MSVNKFSNLQFINLPTKVPFICKELFYNLEVDFIREYYRLNPRLWFSLRDM